MNLDLIPNGAIKRVHVSQNDVGRTLTFELFNNSTSYTIPSGATVKIQGTKPSGFGFSETCTVSGNVATIDTTEAMTDESGYIQTELSISYNGNKIGTSNFVLAVEKNPHPDTTTDGSVETIIPELTLLVNEVKGYAEEIEDTYHAYGSPWVASTVSAMTDTTKIYVYVGSETGYTSGNWYYYDGSAWVSGGIYNSVAVQTDTTLSISGMPADAKVTGDEVGELKSVLNNAYYTIEPETVTGAYTAYASSGGPFYQYNTNAGLQYVKFPVSYNEKYKVTGNLTQAGAVRSFFTISDNAYLSVISISGSEVEFTVPYGAKSAIVCGYTGTPITVQRMEQNGLAGKNVAVFGDSLMAGLELNYNDVDSSLSVSRGIWGRVADHYGCTIVSNQSLGGATIESIYNGDDEDGRDSYAIARRLFKYDNTNTDLIIFTGGYNDAQKQYAGQTVYNIGELTETKKLNVSDWGSCISCLETAFTHLRYKNPYCKIIWIRTWYGGGANEASLVKDYYDAIEACCNKWGVAVCDINRNGNINLLNADDVAKFGRRNYTSASTSTTDTIHLSSVGFDFIMPVVYDTIDRIFKY